MAEDRSKDVLTITEMVDADPDVDNRAVFTELYGVLTELRDRVFEAFDLEPHASCEPYRSWASPDGSFKGSLNTWSSPDPLDGDAPRLEWFVHSWAGNPERSILDMNVTCWLGPQVDVPHLALVFGTVPHPYHYSDLLPRRDLAVSPDYLDRYYEPENAPFLEFRGDARFNWSVSHGSYMRAIVSPACYSFMGERDDETVKAFADHARRRFDRWMAMVEAAEPVPVEQRAALTARDHRLRELCYRRDPMNALAGRVLGEDLLDDLVTARLGAEQMAADAAGVA